MEFDYAVVTTFFLRNVFASVRSTLEGCCALFCNWILREDVEEADIQLWWANLSSPRHYILIFEGQGAWSSRAACFFQDGKSICLRCARDEIKNPFGAMRTSRPWNSILLSVCSCLEFSSCDCLSRIVRGISRRSHLPAWRFLQRLHEFPPGDVGDRVRIHVRQKLEVWLAEDRNVAEIRFHLTYELFQVHLLDIAATVDCIAVMRCDGQVVCWLCGREEELNEMICRIFIQTSRPRIRSMRWANGQKIISSWGLGKSQSIPLKMSRKKGRIRVDCWSFRRRNTNGCLASIKVKRSVSGGRKSFSLSESFFCETHETRKRKNLCWLAVHEITFIIHEGKRFCTWQSCARAFRDN